MSNPTISFVNGLDSSVTVYDSFSKQDPSNYFGTLTLLATVPAQAKPQIQLLHPTSVLIVKNTITNEPVARRIYSPVLDIVSLSVTQADVDAMKQTQSFITFITTNPNDTLASSFQGLWKDTKKSHATLVTDFFANHQPYTSCTFATYMMRITYTAEKPVSKEILVNQEKSPVQTVYSLRSIAPLLGAVWPPEFPDIEVTNFTCNTENDALKIRAEIELKKLPVEGKHAPPFFMSLFSIEKVQVEFNFNYAISLTALCTRLSITSLDEMKVPCSNMGTLTIKKPTVNIDIMPTMKFVNLTVLGTLTFKAFGKDFDVDVSMIINNLEVSFGMVHKDDQIKLPGPPDLAGVHLDEIGISIGILYEPPSAAIGFSGKLHFGELANGVQKSLADSDFAVVCQLIGEVPNPLYLSFYVPKLELTDVVKIFLKTQHTCDVPVSFTDLSFQWCQNPLRPVALPDGSLSEIAYGFSATVNILSFGIHADVSLDFVHGLKADLEIGGLDFGSIFSLTGDGKGYSIKTDSDGNPIKNHLLATAAEQHKALEGAKTKQLVAPGGPVLQLQTSEEPYLHLNASVTLLGQTLSVTAEIKNDGIYFEIDFHGVLEVKVKCHLLLNKLEAGFTLKIDWDIPLPSMKGVGLGHLKLSASIDVHFSVEISLEKKVYYTSALLRPDKGCKYSR